METEPQWSPQRPAHSRNVSSKSNILRSLVSPKARQDDPPSVLVSGSRTQTVPLVPADHPHVARSKVLGERQGNAGSPSSSPSKSKPRALGPSKTSTDMRPTASPTKESRSDRSVPTKKSKSSTNLSGMFARMNLSSKDLPALQRKDKENTTPPSSSDGRPAETPIWAHFATTAKSRPHSWEEEQAFLQDEIDRYTPRDYSPSKQRNFGGDLEQPQLRPTLGERPKSMLVAGNDAGRSNGRRSSVEDIHPRTSALDASEGRKSRDASNIKAAAEERKVSGSSTEQSLQKNGLTINKRGAGERVMAAVAAFQSKTTSKTGPAKIEAPLDENAVNKAFESVLASRNVPEPMREKMRSLTLRVKADFVKQDQEAAKSAGSSPPGTAGSFESMERKSPSKPAQTSEEEAPGDEGKGKRSRPRSRTFTFSKGDKRTSDASPSKKHRSRSKSRDPSTSRVPTAPTTPRTSMDGKRGWIATIPADYISYLRKHTDPVKLEVGRLHKLRILLRNETVAWVDAFLSLGGMAEIVGLLHRILGIEWREEHEDQLLHETLLCLKGLCTTERAMSELEKVADGLFPALIGMLFDEEKKGPAEYATRGIVITVLFNYLAAAQGDSAAALERRAYTILSYVGEPSKPEDARPVDFVLDMRVSRPYKLWCREVSNVTKEVFWIFLHHLNVVPLPRPGTSSSTSSSESTAPAQGDVAERAKVLEATYTQRHFPGIRPPVPAAPYIGGVEWDATTYITAHLDLVNGLIASISTTSARNSLRRDLKASGFEKVLGNTLRTCKEKFYSGVHDGLRAWVAAAAEDGWDTQYVREGPSSDEQMKCYSPKKSPNKKKVEPAPKIEAPKLDFGLGVAGANDGDDGWLG